jgi:G3E family GTPase
MAADLIILNKCDLISEKEKNQAVSKLREFNDEAEIIPTINAKIDIDKLTKNNKSAHRRGKLASCNLPGNRPSSTLLTSEKELPKAALDAFLHDQLPNTWRIKGWIKSDDKWWYISDNAGRLEWKEDTIPDNMQAGLTVITPPGVTEKVQKEWAIFKEKFIA